MTLHLPSLGRHHRNTRINTSSVALASTTEQTRAEVHFPLLSDPQQLLLPSAATTTQNGIGSKLTTGLTAASPDHRLMEEEPSATSARDDFSRDRIQVAVRLKPIPAKKNNVKENSLNRLPGWIVQDNQILQKGAVRKTVGRTVFTMDSVFAESASTRDVYEESVKPIIRSVFSGCHGAVCAYGQTGSGKTFTMQGETTTPGTDSNRSDEPRQGIIAMAANDLFAMIQNAGPQQESTVRVSYYEVYNEEVRDLLAEPSTTTSLSPSKVTRSPFPRRGGGRRIQSSVASGSSSVDTSTTSGKIQKRLPVLTIRESLEGNVFVNASSETVTCTEDVLRLLRKGNLNRACAATDANAQSSRSHAIFKLSLETRVMAQHGGSSSSDSTDANVALKRVSWINLVDLAGSENGRNTGATGARRLEGGKINQSLLALSRVIHSLSLPKKRRPHIGYRDSKLTRILQTSLSGSANVAILCCASLARSDLEETRSTLKFASSAKQIQVKAIVNETFGDAPAMEVVKLQQELAHVKNELKQLQEMMQSQAQAALAASTKIGRVSPLCVGCIETTGSSTTRSSTTQCSTRSNNDTTSSMKPHHRDEAEQNSVEVYAPSLGSDSSGSVSNDSHSHTSRAVGQVDHWHLEDGDDKSVGLQDFCSELSPSPPVQEISVLVRSEAANEKKSLDRIDDGADQRVSFLEEKLEATEDLVEKLYSDLQSATKEMQADNAANLTLDERILRLEEDKENTYEEQKILLGWFILLCLGLYAIGMKEFCLSALIFVWMSLQIAA